MKGAWTLRGSATWQAGYGWLMLVVGLTLDWLIGANAFFFEDRKLRHPESAACLLAVRARYSSSQSHALSYTDA